MVYTVTLNPALDYVIKTPKLISSDINRAVSQQIYYGGKGINVSAVLTRLGIENTALGFLGGFTGKKLEEMLKEDNIRSDFIYISSGDTRINVKIKSDAEIDINADGPTVTKNEIDALLEKTDTLSNGDFLVLSGSIPQNVPSDIYESILKRLDKKGVKSIVDSSGEPLKKALKYKPFLIKPNHHELGELFSVKLSSDSEIVKYASILQKDGAQNVLVSCAENGAILLSADGRIRKIYNAEGVLVNSVGCGDSTVAGFIAGYLKKKDYLYALTLAAACGNATAFSEGLAKKCKVEEILLSGLKTEEL